MIADLETLVNACRAEATRPLVAEAVSSYKAGAYRSCIINTWIALTFDLISKLRELALLGDGAAERHIATLDALIEQSHINDPQVIKRLGAFERELLDVASRDFSLIDAHQLRDLHRLQEDRHLCAHPSYKQTGQIFTPTAEIARAHLVHAVTHVLSQEPVQGRYAVEHMLDPVKSPYFPTAEEEAKTQLISLGVRRARDSLVRLLIAKLLFGVMGEDEALAYRKQTLAAIAATFSLHPSTSEAEMKIVLNKIVLRPANDSRLHYVFGIIRYVPIAKDLLEPAAAEKIRNFLRTAPALEVRYAVPICLQLEYEAGICIERVATFDIDALSYCLKVNHSSVHDACVSMYCSASSWGEANRIYSGLIKPIIRHLTPSHIERILRAPSEEGADLRGSNSFEIFKEEILRGCSIPGADLRSLMSSLGYIATPAPVELDDDIPF